RRGQRQFSGDVDLLEDAFGADFLGVGGHHGIGELLHGVALLERNALELAGLLQRIELDDFLARFQLTAVVAGLLAGLHDRVLQVLRQGLQRFHREANRPDRYRVLRQIEVRRDFVELLRLDTGRLVFAGRYHAVLDGV